jgi:hypothetical protein
MKKVISTLMLVAALATTSNAQFKSILLYGNIGTENNKDAAGNKNGSFAFNPGIGYQFSNELTAGINLGIGGASVTPIGGAKTSNSSFAVGPFLRYTRVLSSLFGVYGQLNAGIRSTSFAGASTGSGMYANIQPSAYVNLKNGFALNFTFGSLGYGSAKATGAASSSTSLGFDFGEGAGFGISKNFAAKARK